MPQSPFLFIVRDLALLRQGYNALTRTKGKHARVVEAADGQFKKIKKSAGEYPAEVTQVFNDGLAAAAELDHDAAKQTAASDEFVRHEAKLNEQFGVANDNQPLLKIYRSDYCALPNFSPRTATLADLMSAVEANHTSLLADFAALRAGGAGKDKHGRQLERRVKRANRVISGAIATFVNIESAARRTPSGQTSPRVSLAVVEGAGQAA